MNNTTQQESSNPILWVIYAGIAIGFLTGLVNGKPGEGLMLGIFTGLCLFIYLLPSYLAVNKKHHNVTTIVALNILLGWLLVPWIACLIWALARNAAAEMLAAQQREQERNAPPPPPWPPKAQPKPAMASAHGADEAFYTGTPAKTEKAMKTCPFCAEEILAAAVKCKHCGSAV